ncbi:TetR/AcrR family transcriptional regulator [Microtetraspora sp. NBRC 13810]|uniref:TetR/AcrR family transcriptional regulator n=1 Tax=Microtetraspora sp. NBRC 13810 TaxID=3030990 RepID=UPI0025546904|nr:TetR/AcrR family transcriptional regulator [Microtetraspora sp. NBRC 13810]
MARTKEFDPDVALGAALELFWKQGYEGTSMADLVEHLGVGRASLYATFGNKQELYLRALRLYFDSSDPNPVEVLSQPGPALPAVRALISMYAESAVTDPRGCMVVNAAGELLPGNAEVTRFVETNWATLEGALTSAFMRARAQGELAPGKDPQALARFALVFLQGLRLVGKGSPDPARVRDAAAQALTLLT